MSATVTPPKTVELPKHSPCEVSASWANWHDAIKRASFTGRRLTLPILACAYLTRDEHGMVSVRSTDLEVFVESTMASAFMDGGDPLLVNARLLLDALNGIKGDLSASQAGCERISVIRDKNGGTVVSGFGRNLKLDESASPGEAASDFPDWPKQALRPVARFASGAFVDGYGFAAIAAGKDNTLPMLTGVQMVMDKPGGPITCVGTDRYRLAINELRSVGPFFDVWTDGEKPESFKVLVPCHAWPVLKSLTARVEMAVEDSGKDRKPDVARFRAGNVSVIVRLLDATFPPYKSLLPSEGSTWVIDRLQLIGDVLAAQSITDRNAPVHVTFDQGKYQVQGCEIHTAIGGSEESWATAFNPAYLLDGLRSFHGDEVSMLGTTATKPFVFTGRRFFHEATYLIMPVRLPG